MKESKLDSVRKVIISAVPSILELKFGCRFNIHEATRVIVGAWPEDDQWLSVHTADGGPMELTKTMLVHPANRVEILGRPIRLADVLIAMKKGGCLRVDSEGWLYIQKVIPLLDSNDYDIKWNTVCKWNLRKDSLDDQSEECVQFLYDILCN